MLWVVRMMSWLEHCLHDGQVRLSSYIIWGLCLCCKGPLLKDGCNTTCFRLRNNIRADDLPSKSGMGICAEGELVGGGLVDVLGGAADVAGGADDVVGGAADVLGGAVDVAAADVVGGAVAVVKGEAVVVGGAADVVGGGEPACGERIIQAKVLVRC